MNVTWNQKYGCLIITKYLQIKCDTQCIYYIQIILDFDSWIKIKMVAN